MIRAAAVLAIPSPSINSFALGPLTIKFYALFILTGIVVAILVTRARARRSGISGGDALDIALWAVVFGIAGSRIWHVLTHPGDYFGAGRNPVTALYIWEGGIAIFGAVLFGAIGIWIGCRRAGVDFVRFADALAPGLLLAQAIGRLGNWFNQELYGAPTTLPWGLQIDPERSPAFPAGLPADTLFQPLFLYELLWNSVGALVIILLGRALRTRGFDLRGASLGAYLIWYGVARAYLEGLRIDPTQLLIVGIKSNQLAASLVALLGAVLLVRAWRRRRRAAVGPESGTASDAPMSTEVAP
ncbi:MAG: prolipoprotein diacylglyceryl transferase [Micrococcales bacterium]|nr:prolipoprotein diacylglyceryl transferase [Micrococcales bacterium]